jgi:hypothetical protein
MEQRSTFKKPIQPHRPSYHQPPVDRHLRRKPQIKEVGEKEAANQQLPGSVEDVDPVEYSFEESSHDSSETSISGASSDLSSSDISGSVDDITGQKLIVALEGSKKAIKEKLASTIRKPIPVQPYGEQDTYPFGDKPLYKPEKPEIPLEDKEGIIYLSHLPYGFFEKQLKKFFKQFGDVRKVNLIRSSKTGNPKGYAYIQFKDPIVAKIVCDTMDGYVMFSRVLKCQIVPPENYSEKFWEKVTLPDVPPNLDHALNLLQPRTRSQEDKKKKKMNSKR